MLVNAGLTHRKKENAQKNRDDHYDDIRSSGRKCPFCFFWLKDGSAFGGHVRMHKNEANYMIIKEIVKFCDVKWFDSAHSVSFG